MTMTVLVADDEPLARRRLQMLLDEVAWARLVGAAGDGAAAVAAVRNLRPDILFLDIRMPELSGLEVVDRLQTLDRVPAIIFTTAFDEYAVTAFELEAVDYLLKPFGRERFAAAIERARMAVEGGTTVSALGRAHDLLTKRGDRARLERLLVRDGSAVLPLVPDDIARIEAQDDYALLHANGRGFLVGLRIRDLEARLPHPPFLRIHRSHIVNLDHVERMVPLHYGRFEVRMADGARVQASRARSQEIRRLAR